MTWRTPFLILPAALVLAQTPAPKPAPAPRPKPAAKPAAPAKPRPAAAAKPKPVAPAEPPVLTVNEEKLTKSDFETLVAALPDQIRARFQSPDSRKKLAQDVAELKAMAQEARRRKMDDDPILKAQIQLQVEQILANALVQQAGKMAAPTEAELRAYYDRNKERYEQVSGRHILVRFKGSPVPARDGRDLTEEEALAKARELRKRVAGGEDFAEVAKKESDDSGSGQAGGDLGTFGRGQMVKSFEDAAFALPVGELSEPVKSQFGYHLIQVKEHKNQTFEEARPMIEQGMGPERSRQFVDEVKKKATIVIDDAYFAAQ